MKSLEPSSAPLYHLVRRAPTNTVRPPLLVLLHGVGSNEKDLFSLEQAFDPRFIVVSPRAPLTIRADSYAWFPVEFTPQGPVADTVQAETSRLLLGRFIDWCTQNYEVDPRQVILAGFSQGAIMAASLALVEPEKVSAAALMSGRILVETVLSAAPLERRIKTQYLVVHGTEDTRLPVHHGRASVQTLRDLGLNPQYQEFSMDHTITDQSLEAVRSWVDSAL